MLHYYNAYSHNLKEAKHKIDKAKEHITPFIQYLNTAIESMKNRVIKAKWIKAQSAKTLELKGFLYEYKERSKIILDSKFLEKFNDLYVIENLPKNANLNEKLFIKLENGEKFSKSLESLKIDSINLPINLPFEDIIKLDSIDSKISKASFEGEDVKIYSLKDKLNKIFVENIESKLDKKRVTITDKKGNEIFCTPDSRLDSNNIKIENISFLVKFIKAELPSNSKLFKINNKEILYSQNRQNMKEIKLKHLLKDIKLESLPQEIQDNIKNEAKECIKLIEIDDGSDEEIESPLKYFLEENVQVKITSKGQIFHYRGECAEFSVRVIESSEYTIELFAKIKDKKDSKKSKKITIKLKPDDIPKDSILEIKPNTYQLEMQKKAILNLQNSPIETQHKFIDLFLNRDSINWENNVDSTNIDSIKWNVLSDETRDGASVQREFIAKALNTNDFAILEGPPGSGKTTVILELICQLISRGKRILLCGSTHVAIDNVLQRAKEKGLMKKFNIFPLRVGKEGAISDEIEEYQIDNVFKKYNDVSSKFLMDIANLVCGTTIGILQYPSFKDMSVINDKNKEVKEMIPEFDYLIIDESSKTTFQEFVVPAMYAKKWILVGDKRQLSPFVERKDLESNLEKLPLNNGEYLTQDYQRACFLLFKLRDIVKKHKHLKFAIGVNVATLSALKNEISKRDKFLESKKFGFYDTAISIFDSLDKDIIFFNESLDSNNIIESFFTFYPFKKDFIKLDSQLYSFLATEVYDDDSKFDKFHKFQENLKKENFLERSFASEIAWRLTREFEMRTFTSKKGKLENYINAIDDLLPKSHPQYGLISKKIGTIATIAQPSILESLISGIKDRYNKTNEKTIIRDGLGKLLDSRHTILTYQSRMHPHISRFPRVRFYESENALKDLQKPVSMESQREWGYNTYRARSVWIDVKGETFRGRNEKEAEALIKELKKFRKFLEDSKQNLNPQGEMWSIAVLSFYKGQCRILADRLNEIAKLKNKTQNFNHKIGNIEVNMKLCSVDKFQGQEADIVFLSMVRSDKIGFLDNPNRLNVGITRAKYQLVIFGDYDFYNPSKDSKDYKDSKKPYNKDEMLKEFAKAQSLIRSNEWK